jgi:hypothetical protein
VKIAFSAAYRPNFGEVNLDVYMGSTLLGSFTLTAAFLSRQVAVAASNVARAGVFMLQNK